MQTNQMALMQKVDTEAQTDGNNIFDLPKLKEVLTHTRNRTWQRSNATNVFSQSDSLDWFLKSAKQAATLFLAKRPHEYIHDFHVHEVKFVHTSLLDLCSVIHGNAVSQCSLYEHL